jgi:hypothetical protein
VSHFANDMQPGSYSHAYPRNVLPVMGYYWKRNYSRMGVINEIEVIYCCSYCLIATLNSSFSRRDGYVRSLGCKDLPTMGFILFDF